MIGGKCVALAVTGGIAAYKSCEIASRLKKLNVDVRVLMTENACRFVSPDTFEAITGKQVYISMFSKTYEIEHISVAKEADIMLVAPATQNILAKVRAGICDDLVSTSIQAMTKPVVFAPAMNSAMYRSFANQENIAVLKRRGYYFIGPETGRLACGDDDIGRMSEPDTITAYIAEMLNDRDKDFNRVKVLVTAGPTRESIDPVRFITNHSSGKMGYAIAEAAKARGADVTLISGPVDLDVPSGIRLIKIVSSQELYDAVMSELCNNDIIIQAAAPADFTPESTVSHKIKKDGNSLSLKLMPTKDIAFAVGERKRPSQVSVIFAAETENLIENAKSKLLKKNAEMAVANNVLEPGAGFKGDTNKVSIITREEVEHVPLMSKRETADRILDKIKCVM